MAFWKRWEAVQHGFESVRNTIERNFDQLSAVLGQYGLEMDRTSARRRADRMRVKQGWSFNEEESAEDDESPSLRLVGADSA